jgi:hypothetical protein
MLIYVKIIKINLKKKVFYQTDRQTHVQLKTVVRNLTKKGTKLKKKVVYVHLKYKTILFLIDNLILYLLFKKKIQIKFKFWGSIDKKRTKKSENWYNVSI